MSFTSAQQQVLTQLSQLWRERQFVLIGASALQIHLTLNRNTRDLDLTLACDLDEFPAGLDRLAGWTGLAGRAHAWVGPGNVRVDVLPAGPRTVATGYVDWPSGARMSVVGFRHAFAQAVKIQASPGLNVEVAPPHVIALLKMIAYLDRPGERGRDLGDIAHLLEYYVDDDDDRRWSGEVPGGELDFEDVSSYLLGRDLGPLLDADERAHVLQFVEAVSRQPVISAMIDRAPVLWQRHEYLALRRLENFRRGLDESTP